jgi:hypothetical protein
MPRQCSLQDVQMSPCHRTKHAVVLRESRRDVAEILVNAQEEDFYLRSMELQFLNQGAVAVCAIGVRTNRH